MLYDIFLPLDLKLALRRMLFSQGKEPTTRNMGKILIVKSSLRVNSNSDFLADYLAKELEKEGKDVSSIS